MNRLLDNLTAVNDASGRLLASGPRARGLSTTPPTGPAFLKQVVRETSVRTKTRRDETRRASERIEYVKVVKHVTRVIEAQRFWCHEYKKRFSITLQVCGVNTAGRRTQKKLYTFNGLKTQFFKSLFSAPSKKKKKNVYSIICLQLLKNVYTLQV